MRDLRRARGRLRDRRPPAGVLPRGRPHRPQPRRPAHPGARGGPREGRPRHLRDRAGLPVPAGPDRRHHRLERQVDDDDPRPQDPQRGRAPVPAGRQHRHPARLVRRQEPRRRHLRRPRSRASSSNTRSGSPRPSPPSSTSPRTTRLARDLRELFRGQEEARPPAGPGRRRRPQPRRPAGLGAGRPKPARGSTASAGSAARPGAPSSTTAGSSSATAGRRGSCRPPRAAPRRPQPGERPGRARSSAVSWASRRRRCAGRSGPSAASSTGSRTSSRSGASASSTTPRRRPSTRPSRPWPASTGRSSSSSAAGARAGTSRPCGPRSASASGRSSSSARRPTRSRPRSAASSRSSGPRPTARSSARPSPRPPAATSSSWPRPARAGTCSRTSRSAAGPSRARSAAWPPALEEEGGPPMIGRRSASRSTCRSSRRPSSSSALGVFFVFSSSSFMARESTTSPSISWSSRSSGPSSGSPSSPSSSRSRSPFFLQPAFVFGLLGLTVFLLMLCLAMPAVARTNRWIVLMGLRFQPSELAKISLVLFLATYVESRKDKLNEIKTLAVPGIVLIVTVVLVLLEPDFGTAVVLLAALAAMLLFIGGVKLRYLAAAGGLAAVLFAFYLVQADYRVERIQGFLSGAEGRPRQRLPGRAVPAGPGLGRPRRDRTRPEHPEARFPAVRPHRFHLRHRRRGDRPPRDLLHPRPVPLLPLARA